MIDLHYWPTPNGHKITLFLEEAGLDYRIVPVNIGAGEQFRPDFLKIAPNTQRAYEKGQAYASRPTVNEDSRAVLFGQTAETLRRTAKD